MDFGIPQKGKTFSAKFRAVASAVSDLRLGTKRTRLLVDQQELELRQRTRQYMMIWKKADRSQSLWRYLDMAVTTGILTVGVSPRYRLLLFYVLQMLFVK